jgi:hypothetical protein
MLLRHSFASVCLCGAAAPCCPIILLLLLLLLLQVLCNALACAGASMADPLMSMVDTYFSGHLGTTALAALGSNAALFRCGCSSGCMGAGVFLQASMPQAVLQLCL